MQTLLLRLPMCGLLHNKSFQLDELLDFSFKTIFLSQICLKVLKHWRKRLHRMQQEDEKRVTVSLLLICGIFSLNTI